MVIATMYKALCSAHSTTKKKKGKKRNYFLFLPSYIILVGFWFHCFLQCWGLTQGLTHATNCSTIALQLQTSFYIILKLTWSALSPRKSRPNYCPQVCVSTVSYLFIYVPTGCSLQAVTMYFISMYLALCIMTGK
jgi:hypothetical protein